MQLFAEGGLKDEGGMIDEVSGNEVPIGGTKEGVRDDIPANVSEGEFVMPADVVRYHGLDKMMQIRQEAKMGLKQMEAMGQMGNSDEATMPDDMPFGMADIMVVGDKGEPMEFADGGFVPVENYTEVQDMISDRGQKSAGYAEGGEVVGQPVPESGQRVLETADTPTIEQVGEIDYDAYMNNIIMVAKEYRNAAGDAITITFINGVPTIPIPEGYTLYVPAVGETVVTTPATEVTAVINENNNNNNNDNDKSPVDTTVAAIDYASMTNDEFLERMEYENTKGYQIQKTVGLAIASMIPFGGVLAYASMRSHARASEARLNSLIQGATTAEEKTRLSGIRDALLKNSKLKPTAESGAIAKWVDGWLIGQGYTTEQAANAATFVSGVESAGVIGDSADQEAKAILDLTDLTKNSLLAAGISPEDIDKLAEKVMPIILDFEKSLDADAGGGSASTNVFATMLNDSNLTPEEREAARQNLTSKEFSDFIGSQENLDVKDVTREQVSGLAPTGDNLVQAPDRTFRDMSQTEAAFGEAVGATPKSVADSSRMLKINEPAKPAGPIGTPDTQGDTGQPFYDTYAKTLGPDGGRTDATTNLFANTDIRSTGAVPQTETARKAANYYSTGAGSTGATSGVGYDPQAQQKGTGNQFTNQASGLDKLAAERAAVVPKSVADSSRMLKVNQPLGTAQQTQQVFGEDYTPTSAELNRQLAASGQTNLTTPTSYDAFGTSYDTADGARRADINMQNATTAGTAPQETFSQAFARNKAAGASTFTHTDGKSYTTETAAEQQARTTVPAGSNTAFQNAANAFTPSDGKEYVGGVLVGKDGKQTNSFYQNAANALTKNDGRTYKNGVLLDDKTGQAYVKPPSDIDDNYGGDIYGPLNDKDRGKTVEDASSGANVVNRTGAPVAKANQEELAKRLGDPGEGNVWGVESGTNVLTKIGKTKVGIKKDGTSVSTTSSTSSSSNNSGGSSNNNSGSSSTSTTSRAKETVQAEINKALKDSGGTWTSELNTLVKERDTAVPAPVTTSSGGGGGGGNNLSLIHI